MVRRLSQGETQAKIEAVGIESSSLEAFAYLDTSDKVVYDWHSHSRHQLLYAFSGTLRVEVEGGVYLLPPQRAVWIPAGVNHLTTLNKVQSGTIFFIPEIVPTNIREVRIISVPPIVKEMILYAMRWPPEREPGEAIANAYFRVLALLCAEWINEKMPFQLPVGKSGQIRKAIDYTLSNLENSSVIEAAGAANVSPRHFRRRFYSETGITWRQFRLQARIMRAMELLIEPDAKVTDVAYAVGFSSLSAFAKSFTSLTSETPSAYRQRVKEG